MRFKLDDQEIAFWNVIPIQSGQLLQIGQLKNFGARAYLTVRGGLDVPNYLDSKSTFALGGFGGHGGRVLRAGDVLRLGRDPTSPPRLGSESYVAAGPPFATLHSANFG